MLNLNNQLYIILIEIVNINIIISKPDITFLKAFHMKYLNLIKVISSNNIINNYPD